MTGVTVKVSLALVTSQALDWRLRRGQPAPLHDAPRPRHRHLRARHPAGRLGGSRPPAARHPRLHVRCPALTLELIPNLKPTLKKINKLNIPEIPELSKPYFLEL